MGIKFYCHACGKKLNVKSFLAGRRGICPHCQAKIDIPPQSEPKRAEGDAPRSTTDVSASGPVAKPAPQSKATVPADTAAHATGASSRVVTDRPTSVHAGGSLSDMIGTLPDAHWFVRPPSGGQYGPASREVMLEWIQQGRVGDESMLWCDGWPEWKKATDVSEALGRANASQDAPARRAIPPTMPDEPSVAASSGKPDVTPPSTGVQAVAAPRSVVARRRRSRSPVVLVVLLVLAVVILLPILIIVLISQRDIRSNDAESETARQDTVWVAAGVTNHDIAVTNLGEMEKWLAADT